VERTWWQIVWLVSRGQTATAIARSTGFSRGWVGPVVKRYNALGPEAMTERRRTHSRRHPLAVSEEQRADLLAAVEGPPPRGDRWTGRRVAEWMSQRLGRPIPRQRGGVSLVRLGGKRRTPRPRHVLADAAQQAAFKKRVDRSSKPSPRPSPRRASNAGPPTRRTSTAWG
jgi:hypothetical protein